MSTKTQTFEPYGFMRASRLDRIDNWSHEDFDLEAMFEEKFNEMER